MVQTYAQKLQNPLWQKNRLAILERDNYTCQYCQDKETNLQIHHFFYLKDYQPWDYEDKDLITYCKHCHSLVEYLKNQPWHQCTNMVMKFTQSGVMMIIAIITDIQNMKHCLLFEYTDSIDFIIAMPEHVITRIEFMFQELKEVENG